MDKNQNCATLKPQGGGAVQPGSDSLAHLRSRGKPVGRGWGPHYACAGRMGGGGGGEGGVLSLLSEGALGGVRH